MSKKIGTVIFVGAGPGDPGLITQKGIEALKLADVVLFDYLAHPNLLLYCRADAQLINVGKRKGFHSETQDTINHLMKTHAQHASYIVRLKGGDPCVFGRVGEEMDYLASNKIPFQLIPGVTSAIAVPAYAGIPVTHRKWSRSFAVITGSAQDGETLQDIHIPNAETLIFLMPVTHLQEIITRVISEIPHFTKDTPTALIYKGTTAHQKTIVATLGTLVQHKDTAQFSPPAILVVGKVASLANTLNWTETLPLFGRRIILLRTPEQGQEWVSPLAMLGAEVVQLPMIDIVPNPQFNIQITQDILDPFSMVIFTSVNGIKQVMHLLASKRLDSRLFAKKTIAVVGSKTASVLHTYGLLPDITPTEYSQEGLLDALPQDLSTHTILIPTAEGARSTLSTTLKKRGAKVEVWPLYRTQLPKTVAQTPIHSGDWIVFTSSSTATHFFEHALWANQKITAFCIGKATHHTVKKYFNGPTVVSSKSTIDATIQALSNYAGDPIHDI